MKRVPFFAAEDDLVSVLHIFEQGKALTYVRTDHYPREADAIMVNTSADLPNIGTATADDAVQCASYLVTSSRPRFRKIQLNDGSDVFAMDQLLNPDSVTLTPGGVRAPDAVIAGALSTASDSPSAQALVRAFTRH